MDKAADLKQALDITVNAKCQRPGVCNAAETLLVHEAVAAEFLPAVVQGAARARGQALRRRADAGAGGRDRAQAPATPPRSTTPPSSWTWRWPSRWWPSLDEAVEHIARYGTGHSEAIVTRDLEASRRFADGVDAAVVYINASTRFTDGGVFGLGAEIGISTQKLHARGPLALKELTSTKYVVTGKGPRPLGLMADEPRQSGRGAMDSSDGSHRSVCVDARPAPGHHGRGVRPHPHRPSGHGRGGPGAVRSGPGGVHAGRATTLTRRAALAPAEFRYLLVSVATASHPRFSVSRFEIERREVGYTVDTLEHLRRRPGRDAKLFFITGADAVLDILTWKRPCACSNCAPSSRPLVPVTTWVAWWKSSTAWFPRAPAGEGDSCVKIMEIPALAISSSMIRERLASGEAARYLVPDPVAQLIEKSGCYRDGRPGDPAIGRPHT